LFRDLMVQLDGAAEDEVRLSHAALIAQDFGVHVLGLYTNGIPELVPTSGFDVAFTSVASAARLQVKARERGDEVFARLTERVAQQNCAITLRRVDAGADELSRLCASGARCADLFVATVPLPKGTEFDWNHLTERIIFEGGHAVYLVPQGRKALRSIRNVLVAWQDTRESARAIAELLPFVGAGTTVRIVTVDANDRKDQVGKVANIAKHLDRYGARVEISATDSNGGTTAGALLDEARRMKADLIVMGGYGHSRFREWILGGVTRDMISQSDAPILMAH
jgi:nucleotide-binding universal stress UspA family protein